MRVKESVREREGVCAWTSEKREKIELREKKKKRREIKREERREEKEKTRKREE